MPGVAKSTGKPYEMGVAEADDGNKYRIFDKKLFETLSVAKQGGKKLRIGYEDGQYGREIKNIDEP